MLKAEEKGVYKKTTATAKKIKIKMSNGQKWNRLKKERRILNYEFALKQLD